MHSSGEEWVIVHIKTDLSGHAKVTVVNRIFRGPRAEAECRSFTAQLNNSSRTDVMEVYQAKRVGDESDEGL